MAFRRKNEGNVDVFGIHDKARVAPSRRVAPLLLLVVAGVRRRLLQGRVCRILTEGKLRSMWSSTHRWVVPRPNLGQN